MIQKLWTDYRDLIEACLAAAPSDTHHRDLILRDTARRIHHLAP